MPSDGRGGWGDRSAINVGGSDPLHLHARWPRSTSASAQADATPPHNVVLLATRRTCSLRRSIRADRSARRNRAHRVGVDQRHDPPSAPIAVAALAEPPRR